MRKMEFDFPLNQLDRAKQSVTDFLLAQTPMSLHRGAQIGFVISNVGELTLVSFSYERMTIFQTIESSNQGGQPPEGRQWNPSSTW